MRACAVLGCVAWLVAARAAGTEPLLLTIDDLPLVSAQYFTRDEQARQFRAILDTIERHGARGVFFVNGERVRSSDEPLLDELVRRGHLVGNHTYSHPSLNDVTPEAYQADILRNDRLTARWLTTPRYFRYPYLQTGITRKERDGVAAFLAANGYRTIPVTIDTDDWDFNIEYTRALKRKAPDDAAAVARRYLEGVSRNAAKARAEARTKVGRDVAHVMLMHMNLLNADVLEPLLSGLEKDGLKFASVDEVMADSVYGLEDDYFGPQGLTWLDRVLR